jgi:hypothetical protein
LTSLFTWWVVSHALYPAMSLGARMATYPRTAKSEGTKGTRSRAERSGASSFTGERQPQPLRTNQHPKEQRGRQHQSQNQVAVFPQDRDPREGREPPLRLRSVMLAGSRRSMAHDDRPEGGSPGSRGSPSRWTRATRSPTLGRLDGVDHFRSCWWESP